MPAFVFGYIAFHARKIVGVAHVALPDVKVAQTSYQQ
jgi:hypothetical protein